MSQRFAFANQLRGLAAACVACSHLIGVYWAMQPAVAAATFSPMQGGALPGLFWLTAHPWFNFGPFGVGVFFLISGFVIPFSLDQHTRFSFIAARLLRIYPTAVAALLVDIAVLYAAARYWGRPFGYGVWPLVANALLIFDVTGQPSVDLVNWTLCVELKFYLLAALLAPVWRRGSLAGLFGPALLLVGANALMHAGLIGTDQPDPSLLTYNLSMESVYLVFMLTGVLFHFHVRGRLSSVALAGSVAAMAGLFVLASSQSALRSQVPVVTVNYGYALSLFATLYAARRWVPPNRVLGWMADISFPFYLLHSMLGFSALKLLTLAWGVAYAPALVWAVAVVVLAATVLHVAVERPTARMGARLQRAQSSPGTPCCNAKKPQALAQSA